MDQVNITFVGHATALIGIGGQWLLTDPNFSDRIWGLRRKARPGLEISALPELAAVLVSHAHYDHFDLRSLRQLDPGVPLILPRRTRGVAGTLPGRRLVELRHGEGWEQGALKVTAVPARHFGGRWLVDSPLRPANGYVIAGPTGTVYFAGDTAGANPFAEIGRRFRLDVALLPIGAYRPSWVMRWSHLSPAQALHAFRALKARVMIPIHWGTFRLSLEPMDEPVRRLQALAGQAGLLDRIVVLGPGESWSPR
jgi:L-ascorbate metabolism protein UlaG (beta-lactamase superfamily)